MEKITLINGQFSSEEAQEILMNILSSKIRFHEMKNFSSQERLGEPDKIAQKRIPELKEEMEKIKKLIAQTQSSNQQMNINSEINISFSMN